MTCTLGFRYPKFTINETDAFRFQGIVENITSFSLHEKISIRYTDNQSLLSGDGFIYFIMFFRLQGRKES